MFKFIQSSFDNNFFRIKKGKNIFGYIKNSKAGIFFYKPDNLQKSKRFGNKKDFIKFLTK